MTAQRRCLPLLLALTLPVLAVPALVAPLPAHAQQAVLSSPIVDLVPMDEVVGDGQTAATLHLVAIGTDGNGISGLSGKVIPTKGDAGRLEEIAPGHYRLQWTPPAVDEPEQVELTIRAKDPAGGAAIVSKVKVPVVPSLAHSVSVAASPARLVLSQDSTATLTVNLSGGAEGTLSGADLAVQASSGTVANVTPLGRGQYSILYTAPDKKFPHLALLTISDRRAPGATVGGIALAMHGKAPFPVTGEPDSSLTVRVGSKEFGPVQSNAQGKATVTLTVPPGVTNATVISVKGDQRTEAELDLKVPPSRRVQLFPLAPVVPADGRSATMVQVFVAQPDGQPDTAAKVTLSATSGTFAAVRHVGSGIYAADWTPAVSSQATTAQVTVKIEDAASEQADTRDVRLLPARPETLALEAVPAQLPATDGHFKVKAKVTGPNSGRGVSFGIVGGQQEAASADRGQGVLEAGFTAPGDGRVVVQGAVLADASSNPLARVLVFASSDRIDNDGKSQAVLTVLTVDADGYPVGNAPVSLQVTSGDAKVPASVTTDAHGAAHATFTAGSRAGLVAVQASTSGHIGRVGVVQLPAAAASVSLPISGDAQALALRTRWDPLVTGLSVPRPDAAGTIAATAASTATTTSRTLGAAISALEITPSATKVSPGDSITLTIMARDKNGAGAPGRELQVFTNAGTATTTQDKGGGVYETTLTAPASGTDVIRVTVVSPDSGVSNMLEVPVGEPEPVWGIAAEDTATPTEDPEVREAPVMPTTEPVAETEVEVKPEKTPREDGNHPWLRVQAGFSGGFYSYRQVPFTSRGPLYGETISFGGGETPAAGSAGIAVNAKAWSPGADYFGARVGVRSQRYAVELADFNAVVPDWVNQVELLGLIRYPMDSGNLRVSPALRLGLGIDDFMVYRQDTSADPPVLDYGPLIVPAFDIGAEIELDVDGQFFAEVGGTIGLNGGGGLYSTDLAGTVGYAFLEQLYIYGDLGWMSRATNVYVASDGEGNQDVGELDDALTSFGIGLGYQL